MSLCVLASVCLRNSKDEDINVCLFVCQFDFMLNVPLSCAFSTRCFKHGHLFLNMKFENDLTNIFLKTHSLLYF